MSWELSSATKETLEFFASQFTVIDYSIIGIGVFLFGYQLYLYFFSGKILRNAYYFRPHRAQRDYHRKRLELELRIISSLIEILPVLGILGTVWGLMNALSYISRVESPTIGVISQRLAPALSTTLFGLIFAALNLFVFNFISSYFEEIFYVPEAGDGEGGVGKEGGEEETVFVSGELETRLGGGDELEESIESPE